MKKIVVYIHGKGGTAAEAGRYTSFFPDCKVVGFNYKARTPWIAKEEFAAYFDTLRDEYDQITVIANSIGAYYAILGAGKYIDRAFLISPIVDMEKVILKMMEWANVSEEELQERKTIETGFNETLSWNYLDFVRRHPLDWQVRSRVLYGEKDNLTDHETISDFVQDTGSELTIMKGGEHWFHTPEQMGFLDAWLTKSLKEDGK